MRKTISHNLPTMSKREVDALSNVVSSNWIAEGEKVTQLEKKMAALHNVPEGCAIAVSSGSAALYLALISADARGKRIALPAYSCASLENAVLLAGGRPVYLDTVKNGVHVQPYNSDNFDILIAPHMFGFPMKIPRNLQHRTIEDCAQAIGSKVDGEMVGTQSSLSIFSFYATKMLTTSGQGGMVIAKDMRVAEYIRDFIHFDCKSDGRRRFNFLMTDIQAAMGVVQLDRLFKEFIPRREAIYKSYVEAGLDMFNLTDQNIVPVRYRALYKTENPERIVAKLAQLDIDAIIPIEKSEILGGCLDDFPNSIDNTKRFVSLPCYPSLSDFEVDKVISAIKEIESNC